MALDRLIKQKFSASFMNNTKWRKLIEALTYEYEDLYVFYKLVPEDKIRNAYLYDDYYNWFLEPITFKEVEWISFPYEYEITQNKRVSRRIIKKYTQDIDLIENSINKVGQFMIDKTPTNLTLYAYR